MQPTRESPSTVAIAEESVDPQRDVLAFLSAPAAYGLPDGAAVERIDTHISVVWLAGPRAYKLKRAVAFDYVDFSQLEFRRAACEAEVRINRRTAPSLYVGVLAVTRQPDGRLALGGGGEPVEWLVEMVRFDGETLFDRLAEGGRLDVGLMEDLAEAIVHLHSAAEPRVHAGGRHGMAWVVEGNAEAFDRLPSAGQREAGRRITADSRAAIERHGDLLEARLNQGSVRACHGDLHLRNICLVDGRPTLFDAIEFNDRISDVDVLYDLAFLLMDLWHRRLFAHANAIFNAYLQKTVDLGGLPLLPLFLSCRAAVLAKTSAASAGVQSSPARRAALQQATDDYLRLADALLHPAPPCLVAIGGFSGSGKSTLARGLAPGLGAVPGALILRSDAIRKQQLGVAPLTRLEPSAYMPRVSRHVYQTLAERAATALRAGHAVVADAVYSRPEEHEEIARVAGASAAPFVGLWLGAPTGVLVRRLTERTADISDATPAVLHDQLRSGAAPHSWQVLDAALTAAEVLARASARVAVAAVGS